MLPSSVDMLLYAVDSTVNFKPFENPIIREQVNKLREYANTIDFINQLGMFFVGLIVSIALIALLVVFIFIMKN